MTTLAETRSNAATGPATDAGALSILYGNFLMPHKITKWKCAINILCGPLNDVEYVIVYNNLVICSIL